jgi:hypothetical protein
MDADVDVLLILDCCFASQAGRAHEERPGRVELLAAAANSEQTPMPGPGSFTKGIMREMKTCFEESGHVTILDLHKRLMDRRAKLKATPFYLKLQDGPRERSIRLEPLVDADLTTPVQYTPGSILRLLLRTEELNKTRI